MNHITFSHKYIKLNNSEQATLVNVSQITLSKNDMNSEFIKFDTTFIELKTTNPKEPPFPFYGRYKLKEGKYLLLLFFSGRVTAEYNLFTTIRPYNKQKEEYYRGLIGQEFEIIIKES